MLEKIYFVYRLTDGHRFRVVKTQPLNGEWRGPFEWGEAQAQRLRLNEGAMRPPRPNKKREFETDQERRLVAFLLGFGKALNLTGVEDEAGLPFRSIRSWMNRNRTLAQKHLDALEAWAKLRRYE